VNRAGLLSRASRANLLDKAIAYVAPALGLQRAQARAQRAAVMAISGSYDAARRTRLNTDWIPRLGSADTDILYDLDDLRARSREIMRNDGYGQILTAIVDHVVGCGMRPHSRVIAPLLGIQEEEAEKFEEAADGVFTLWSPWADVSGLHDFGSFQALVYLTELIDGECFVHRVSLSEEEMQERGAPYSLAYEIIDADRVISPSSRLFERNSATGHKVRHGIEFDAKNRRVAYWVLKDHPAERHLDGSSRFGMTDFIRVPAAEMIHLFKQIRPGQTRGVPHLAPELDTFHTLDRLYEAELITALLVACHSLFIRKRSPVDAVDGAPGGYDASGRKLEELEPGQIKYLEVDEEPFAFNPNRPSGTLMPFAQLLMRKLASVSGTTYELLAKDFSQTNFSSGRQSALLAQKFFNREQHRLTFRFGQPIRVAVLEESWAAGELQVTGSMTARRKFAYFHAVWAGPGYGYVDPTKEVTASEGAVIAGVSTLSQENAKVGNDWRETLTQQGREKKFAERKGLKLSVFEGKQQQQQPSAPPEPPDTRPNEDAPTDLEEAA